MRKVLIVFVIIGLIAVGRFVWLAQHKQTNNTQTQVHSVGQFNTRLYSTDSPNSIWVIVNKHRQLKPASYSPTDLVTPGVATRLNGDQPEMQLRREAATALEQLFAAARRDGHELMLASGYRSYSTQQGLYNHYVNTQGQAIADTQSARPGYSEHQTGLAADIEPASRACEIDVCFADLPEGIWLAQHAHRYGFIIRYTKDTQTVTGYIYEPWHLRYVGNELAQEVHDRNNQTLEEFFNIGPAPRYNP